MKLFYTVSILLFSLFVLADTPPPGTVKAKMFSGDGLTGITTTGTSMNVNVTNSSGTSTVNQGTAGVSPWLVNVNNSSIPVTQSGSWSVNQSAAPWSFSLPSGAATSALQSSGNASLSSIDSKLSSPLAVTGPLTDTQLRAAAVPVSGTFFQATQPVSAASLPLPSGAATSALQTSGNASLTSIDAKLTAPLAITGSITATNTANGATGSAVPAQATQVAGSDGTTLRAVKVSSTGVVSVDGSAVTQPVSIAAPVAVTGTFFQATQPVSAASLPLPSGAATAALQTSGNASLTSIDSKLTSPLTVTGPLTDTQLRATPVPISGSITATNTANGTLGSAAPTQGTQVAGSDGTNLRAVKVSSTGVVSVDGSATTQPVSAASLPLPSGAATAALQTSGNASLTSIDSKLTSPLTVTGTVTSNIGTTNGLALNSTLTGGTAQNRITDGTNVAAVKAASTAAVATDPALVVAISPNNPISVSNTANGNTGAAVPTQATQIAGSDGTNLRAVKVSSAGVVFVDGSAATQPVSGAVTANAGTNLNTSALALESGGNLAALNAKFPALGAQNTANSSAVTIATDQAPISVSQPDLLITGQAAQTAIGNNILLATAGTGALDVSGYRSASVQVVSTGTAGTFIFENSNDGTNFQTMTVYNSAVITGTPIVAAVTATATQLIYTFPIRSRFIRVRIVTAITGGSLQAFSRISQESWSPAVMQVAQATAANLATTATIASGTVTTVTTVGSVTSAQTAIPGTIADVASAAITTTTTTATLTPTFGSSYQVNIPVTAVSGTTPSMQVDVQESLDTGTNWQTVYSFPAITATGFYQSPLLQLQGNRVRYVQTISGTTPSFTRAINRLQSSNGALKVAPSQGILSDGSGSTSATPSTSTQIFAANPIRRYLFIENLDASNTIYINFTSAATANTGSIAIAPGGSFVMESSFVSQEAVTVLATAASVKFTAKQY